MGYRIFRDSRGAEWQTWDVVPRLGERRVSERRARIAMPVETDRRSAQTRRVHSGPRGTLKWGMNAGWLCFETAAEKRRLTPIPSDWEKCPREQLEAYCAQARRARRPILELHVDPIE